MSAATQENKELNVDPHEIDKFSQLAHKWWDKNSEFKPLHDINPLRVHFIERIAGLTGQKVLDVGCGGGILSEGMAEKGADVTGIDMAEKSLKVAKLHLLESGQKVTYRCVPAEQFAEENPETFDVVVCMEMLEHVPEPASIVASCAALVKPGGYVFFSTLNRNPKSYLMAVLGAEYLLGMLPKGTHEYGRFIKPSELVRMTRGVGLELVEMSGLTFNPISQQYSLNNDTDVNYMIACRKDPA
ncbi:bifunctional 2-polyprenyl-6-hydroxyphenol methylase/3-demethylubiquinol 3-O-methyltransferase UbiG [Leeia sp. TBRC 13508]|uniref:Ubiquinone biosynthesis O-methyltransferase n=1 Tax=Leeia speluncae TaxID=2884804 RepID=A0ABS8D4I4_9NEIS|nr:bifunctional 2-polyprenyl-6-hydroxyphenol methylase/3-demethylubiquinol 3-O-methyltransferase UbiG [Leeia speluncae]MCB6183129.1 bifunctional 2-polyprenyl-6-hydroxyphenol methylase/3-demethylubiquinol 3-O-methyltransferase UbiG [Leeia speluncae]